MATYTVYKADGTTVNLVPDGNSSTQFYAGTPGGSGKGIQLIGQNMLNYGQPIAQNFVQITENFADVTGKQPLGANSLQGQLWYDRQASELYVRKTTAGDPIAGNWKRVITVDTTATTTIPFVNPTPGTEKDGDIRVRAGPAIDIWAAGAYRQIYPTVAIYG